MATLGELEPGDMFLLPKSLTEGTVIGRAGQDVDVILDGPTIGQEAVMSSRREVVLLGKRAPNERVVH
jgi:hypothetical protein